MFTSHSCIIKMVKLRKFFCRQCSCRSLTLRLKHMLQIDVMNTCQLAHTDSNFIGYRTHYREKHTKSHK